MAGDNLNRDLSIGSYLIQRLQDYGMSDSSASRATTCCSSTGCSRKVRSASMGPTREDCAGFAADGYARVNGMGAVCVTYCVGGLSLCNSIAGAYAEKSPVSSSAARPVWKSGVAIRCCTTACGI